MADGLHQFDVDDDSPGVAYFPLVNLEPSANVSAGWQLLYTLSGAATGPGQVGVGSSYHYTSLDGASLMLNWNGTGIDLVGTVSNALYNVSLDGTPSAYGTDPASSILVSLDKLANTNHSLLLTTIITNSTSPNAFLTFDKAVITYTSPDGSPNTTATSQAIADADIAFMGLWNYVTDSTGNSMHVSTSAGDSANATFRGSAITIYGLTSSYSGNFTVTLDNVTTQLSARSSYNDSDSLLFYATDLPEGMPHQITVINQENTTLALRAGGVNVTTFGNTTTSPTNLSSSRSLPAGTIAAIVLAVVLLLVLVGIFYYACRVQRKSRAINHRGSLRGESRPSPQKRDADIERVTSTYVPSGEELESTSLSTSKGYGFGLGLRRGFTFLSRKNKSGSNSSERCRNGTVAQPESHPMTPQHDRDEKRLSIFTLTEDLPVLANAPESEKLAPGWYNPITLPPPSFNWKDTRGVTLPELRVQSTGLADNDDADVKTLTSRQDEALVATLLLSPRTSEALAVIERRAASRHPVDTRDGTRCSDENQPPEFLRVRDVSPFRIDVSSILAARRGARDSKRSSGSGGSTWSRVRSRLYRGAHRDDGRQSHHTDRQEASSSSGPESVPVVMHDSGLANPPSEAAPGSGAYSFLDFTSSRVSLGRYSRTTLSSVPVELGHGAREASAWGEGASVRPLRIERSRDDVLAPKPDAPSTASGGSHPSDNSDDHTAPTAPTMHTQASSHFPFPITIPPSPHIAQSPEHVPERHFTPSPPRTPPSRSDQYLQVPQITRPEPVTPANSPTESVPFSVSEIYFRHSFSDHDSRRGSAASGLPPHPPLPRLDGSPTSPPTYSPPPPYIVQRVLGLPTSPLSPLSPIIRANPARTTPLSSNPITGASVRRPGTAPTHIVAPTRVGSLLGPRPRPSTAGSVRVSAAPQLPMQGGRSGGLRGQR